MRAIAALERHTKLHLETIKQMVRLIQGLGSHSITAAELKLLLRLMRGARGGNEASIYLQYYQP